MTLRQRLERRVEALEHLDDLPTVGVITAFQALDLETELVDRDRAIYRIDGRLWHDRHGLLDGSGYIYDN